MTVTIEVFGAVRALLGGATERLDVAGPLTVRGALALVATRHPAVVGSVLAADGCTPTEHFLVNLDGKRFIHDLDEVLADGSHVLLMTAVAGGAPQPASGWAMAPEIVPGNGIVVEIDDPVGAVTRWQRYGRDRLFLEGLKGVYIGLDDGNAPEFNNPAYPWGCEQISAGGRLGGYRYWYRQPGASAASVVVRFAVPRSA